MESPKIEKVSFKTSFLGKAWGNKARAFNKTMQVLEDIPGKYAARYKLYSLVRKLNEAAIDFGRVSAFYGELKKGLAIPQPLGKAWDNKAKAFNKTMQALEGIPGKYAARYKLYSLVRKLNEAAQNYGATGELRR